MRNWFNHQDFEQNLLDGKSIYERMLSKYSIHNVDLKALVAHFKRKDGDQFFADIGRGLITLGANARLPANRTRARSVSQGQEGYPGADRRRTRSASTASATC